MNRIKTIWCNWPVWLKATLALAALWVAVRVGIFGVVLVTTLINSEFLSRLKLAVPVGVASTATPIIKECEHKEFESRNRPAKGLSS